MHAIEVKQEALRLVAAGLNDSEISRRLDVPRATIREWRVPRYVPKSGAHRESEICPRCWHPARPMVFTPEDYTELLGLYLGDGHIRHDARTYCLRIYLDPKYPNLIRETAELLQRCFVANRVSVIDSGVGGFGLGRCRIPLVYSTHLPCLFPQHGAGLKHLRRIKLEPWQEDLVTQAPWGLIRGLIRSDGCSFINRTDVHRPQPYEYLSYHFSNMSDDIVELFTSTCRAVGVFTRATRSANRCWAVRINRRESVALLERHVGTKS